MTDDVTWEDGPWIVEIRHRFRVTDTSSEDARRYAQRYLVSDPTVYAQVQSLSVQTDVMPDTEPFDFDPREI